MTLIVNVVILVALLRLLLHFNDFLCDEIFAYLDFHDVAKDTEELADEGYFWVVAHNRFILRRDRRHSLHFRHGCRRHRLGYLLIHLRLTLRKLAIKRDQIRSLIEIL